jgi:carbonic anhydrase
LALAAPALAAPSGPPPKPHNVVSPDEALKRLMAGNAHYVGGVTRRRDFAHDREALAGGQNPFASILGCADSRVAPETIFDVGRGDLFVCRVAGNFANDDVVASLEYSVAVLGAPLIMVLGHGACGALSAAIKSIDTGETLPGHLPSLVEALAPAVRAAHAGHGDRLNAAIRENVVLTVRKLETARPILSAAVEQGKLRVVGAVYHLADGRVDLVT